MKATSFLNVRQPSSDFFKLHKLGSGDPYSSEHPNQHKLKPMSLPVLVFGGHSV
uniref:Uncharacterized protein n=1 Tax=Anguilla anguilla TaxID=7936 RepID=A0A0E9W5L0_ANGAN